MTSTRTVPTGTRPPRRHRYLVECYEELAPTQQAQARRDADTLRATHTLYAAWSVAITRAQTGAN